MSATDGIVHRSRPGTFIPAGDGNIGHGETVPVKTASTRRRGWIGLLLALAVVAAAILYFGHDAGLRKVSNLGFITNNSYIEGLYANVNAKKTATVFRYVFRNLEDEVMVYPSENYYYFTLTMRGKTLSGDIHLDVLGLDSGMISCGFVEKFEDRSRAVGRYRPSWTKEFGPSDGLRIKKLNDFRYAITFEGRTVIFNLYDGDTARPVKARLTDDEVYVGPSFDESGLRFFLIFNKGINRLYWVLNEDGYVPEGFSRVSDHVVTGDRTEFAFYLDSANNRKLLVGVQGLNIAHNNWFDGPFDQLPDNYVKTGRVEIHKYLEAHLGYKPGTLDRFGNFVGKEKEARAVIIPYINYFVTEDLLFVDSAVTAGLAGTQLYEVLTRQRFDINGPAEKGHLRRM